MGAGVLLLKVFLDLRLTQILILVLLLLSHQGGCFYLLLMFRFLGHGSKLIVCVCCNVGVNVLLCVT